MKKRAAHKARELGKELWFIPAYAVYSLLLSYFKPVIDSAVLASVGQSRIEKAVSGGFSVWFSYRALILVILPGIAVAVAFVNFLRHTIHRRPPQTADASVGRDFCDKIRAVTEDFDYVESIQLYQFKKKQENSGYTIRINFLCGFADEDVEIGAALQTYYRIPNTLYGPVGRFCALYDRYGRETDEDMKTVLEKDLKMIGVPLVKRFLARLRAIEKPSAITECDCVEYRLLRILFPILNRSDVESYALRPEIEEALLRGKETGLLGPVLFSQPQVFKNEPEPGTGGRIFFAGCAGPYKGLSRLIVLIAVREELLEKSETIEKYGEEIFRRLHRELAEPEDGT